MGSSMSICGGGSINQAARPRPRPPRSVTEAIYYKSFEDWVRTPGIAIGAVTRKIGELLKHADYGFKRELEYANKEILKKSVFRRGTSVELAERLIRSFIALEHDQNDDTLILKIVDESDVTIDTYIIVRDVQIKIAESNSLIKKVHGGLLKLFDYRTAL